MKRTDLKKHLAALLTVLCLLASSALPAFAASADIQLVDGSGNPTKGSIHITLYDNAAGQALSGAQLTLYRVAELKRTDGTLSYAYCGYFYGCGIALGDLTDSTLAEQLQAFLPAGAEGTVQTADEDGNVTFTDLELGLYLVVQTKASGGYEPINSFLVSLPMEEDGQWNYTVDATPKVGTYVPQTPPDTPDHPVIPGTPVNPVSPGRPDNPILPGNPDNPVSPGRPDNPVMSGLPQTGQLNWPVPVLAISGVTLFAFGWVLDRRKTI